MRLFVALVVLLLILAPLGGCASPGASTPATHGGGGIESEAMPDWPSQHPAASKAVEVATLFALVSAATALALLLKLPMPTGL